MIYLLNGFGRQAPNHIISLKECHVAIEKSLNNYRPMWHKMLFVRVHGKFKCGIVELPDNMRDIAQVLCSSSWADDRAALLKDFDVYYHNCTTARALMDVSLMLFQFSA